MHYDSSTRESARTRINVDEAHELRYWSDELGCSRQQLLELVETNGVVLSELWKCLKR